VRQILTGNTRLLFIKWCLSHNRLFHIVYIITSLITGDADDVKPCSLLLPRDIHCANDWSLPNSAV